MAATLTRPNRARPAPPSAEVLAAAADQPNELDLRRIARALDSRARYRYVSPRVEAVIGGYRVVSACCSRTVDPQGGEIDIARLEYAPNRGEWELYRKDHQGSCWVLHACARQLAEMLALLRRDPARVFWP